MRIYTGGLKLEDQKRYIWDLKKFFEEYSTEELPNYCPCNPCDMINACNFCKKNHRSLLTCPCSTFGPEKAKQVGLDFIKRFEEKYGEVE